eukprot:8828988-Karenia_brevis.AAC.1
MPIPGAADVQPIVLGVCMPRGNIAVHVDIICRIMPAYGKRVASACGVHLICMMDSLVPHAEM